MTLRKTQSNARRCGLLVLPYPHGGNKYIVVTNDTDLRPVHKAKKLSSVRAFLGERGCKGKR